MVGLIWTIQLVHYPLFGRVGADSFTDYEAEHTRRMGMLLAVPASIEVITGGLLLWLRPESLPLWVVLASGFLLAFIWVVTLLVQVPLHGRLGSGFDPAAVRRLVDTNWWRTIAWSIRGLAVAGMLVLV
jgi:hypothetical protein